MTTTVLAFPSGHFTAADLTLLRTLTAARTQAGEWSAAERLTPGPDCDCWTVFLPGGDYAAFSLERHPDGRYRRMDGQGGVVRTTRTLSALLAYPDV